MYRVCVAPDVAMIYTDSSHINASLSPLPLIHTISLPQVSGGGGCMGTGSGATCETNLLGILLVLHLFHWSACHTHVAGLDWPWPCPAVAQGANSG